MVAIVLVEQGSDLVGGELAAKLIQGSCETLEVAFTGVCEIEILKRSLGCLALAILGVCLLSDFLEQDVLNLVNAGGTNIVLAVSHPPRI